MKKGTVIAVAIIIALSSIIIFNSLPKYSREEIAFFKQYKADFVLIKDYLHEKFDQNDTDLAISFDFGVSTYPHNVKLEIKSAFARIKPAFKGYEFSFADVTTERISFGGLGYRMYVFSKDGKAPKYFYYPGDGMHFECFTLGDDWYLLTVNFR